MNITNIIIVGLISGAVTVGIGYLLLAKLADFQWWWLIALFGAQFLSVILVAYVLEQKFGCGAKTTVSSCKQTVDWSCLRKTAADAPPTIIPAPINSDGAVNSADWQDLLKQLDQMSKEPATPEVAAKPSISAATVVCPPVTPTAVQPASPPTFDFSAIANAFATPTPAPTTARTSDVIPAAKVSKTPSTPVLETPPTQTIDFASLFR